MRYYLSIGLLLVACGPAPTVPVVPSDGILDPTDSESSTIQRARDKWEAWGGLPDDLLDSVAGYMVTSDHPWIKRAQADVDMEDDIDTEFVVFTEEERSVVIGLYRASAATTLYVRDAIKSLGGEYHYALYLVGAHEFGHALGGPLGSVDRHSANPRSVLFPTFHWGSWILESEFGYWCFYPQCPDERLDANNDNE